MKSSVTLKWIGLAMLGLLIAAAVALAGSELVSRQIGLSSEPISAGDSLVPARFANEPGPSRPVESGAGAPGEGTAAPVEQPASPPSTDSRGEHSGGSDDGPHREDSDD